MKLTTPDLFGSQPPKPPKHGNGRWYRGFGFVPQAAYIVACAIWNIGHPATEIEIIRECARLHRLGMHEFNLGLNTNIRNRFHRNSADYSIFHTDGWKAKGYADIFRRFPGKPARYGLVQGFKP